MARAAELGRSGALASVEEPDEACTAMLAMNRRESWPRRVPAADVGRAGVRSCRRRVLRCWRAAWSSERRAAEAVIVVKDIRVDIKLHGMKRSHSTFHIGIRL